MKITLNPDKEIVKTVKEGLKRTGGYCPCRMDRTDDTECMCKEFREQIKDTNFEGLCPPKKNGHKKAIKNGMNRSLSFVFERLPHLFHGLLDNEPLPT